MLQLYKNIKERRIQLGITQTELAKRLGYSDKSMISKIENGKVDLPVSKIVEFAEILRTDAGELMGEDGIKSNDKSNDLSVHTIAAHFDGDEFSEDELDEIREFAEFVKQKSRK